MPQFTYRGRDRDGNLRVGERYADSSDMLNAELIKEGITLIDLHITHRQRPYLEKLLDLLQGEHLYYEELAIFSRQMQLLLKANVPINASLLQLSTHTRSKKLAHAIKGLTDQLEKGATLASAMKLYPNVFSPLMINIVEIGESTGRLSESFAYLYEYIEFESTSFKQIRASLRYPLFVFISILSAIIILNVFVIPTFARYYTGLKVSLPWETKIIIATSNFFVNYGYYLLAASIISIITFVWYIHTPIGKYKWNKFELRLPFIGALLNRVIIIRFCQSFSIIIKSGIPINQGLTLIHQIITNTYIQQQIHAMQEDIERGISFTQAINKVELFTPLEIQILAVGEKNGELAPALAFISNFHGNEIQYDLKRLNDLIGPITLASVSIIILVVALGVYLPIWNMVNLKN